MQKEEKMIHIMIDLYADNSEGSRRIEELFRKHFIPYVKRDEPMPEYDKRMKRPYITIGDPNGTPLGPSANTRWIEWVVECLASSPRKLVDPRVSSQSL